MDTLRRQLRIVKWMVVANIAINLILLELVFQIVLLLPNEGD